MPSLPLTLYRTFCMLLYRNGYSKSHWIYTPLDGQLKGKIAAQSHCFEEGNVQSFCLKTFAAPIDPKLPDSQIIEMLCSFMKASDALFLRSLNESHENLSEFIFKVSAGMSSISACDPLFMSYFWLESASSIARDQV
jgi:hypothetical protein